MPDQSYPHVIHVWAAKLGFPTIWVDRRGPTLVAASATAGTY